MVTIKLYDYFNWYINQTNKFFKRKYQLLAVKIYRRNTDLGNDQ